MTQLQDGFGYQHVGMLNDVLEADDYLEHGTRVRAHSVPLGDVFSARHSFLGTA